MPNRILKESICSSENVDALSIEAETFFYRLIVQCDDYGRMDARANILRARCFPLRLDKITDKHICEWVAELETAGLIQTYSVQGHAYLHFIKWDAHQQIRAKRSKYPDPIAADNDLQSSDINGNQVITNVPVIQSNPIQSESNIPGAQNAPEPPMEPDKPDALKELAQVFEQASGVELASIPRKQRGPQFWYPLGLMLKTGNGTAPETVRAAVSQLQKSGMTISDPNSILKTFNSLNGRKRVGPGTKFKEYTS